MKLVSILLGCAVASTAAWSAFAFSFKHFYELLMFGLLLVLMPHMPKGLFTLERTAKLWAMFFLAGLVVDLLIGLLIIKGWYYNYSALWEYIVLYAWVYPAGGLVLVASYLIAKRFFIRTDTARRIDKKVFWILFGASAAAVAAVLLIKDLLLFNEWNFLFGTTAILALITLSDLMAEMTQRNSYVRELLLDPPTVLFATLIATYINALIHEYPNVWARQWVYVVNTGTFLDTLVLGFPVAVWLLWPLLTIGAVTIFYRTEKVKLGS